MMRPEMNTRRMRVLRGAAGRRDSSRGHRGLPLRPRTLSRIAQRMALPAPAMTPPPDPFVGLRLLDMPEPGNGDLDTLPPSLLTPEPEIEPAAPEQPAPQPAQDGAAAEARPPLSSHPWLLVAAFLGAAAAGTWGAARWVGYRDAHGSPRPAAAVAHGASVEAGSRPRLQQVGTVAAPRAAVQVTPIVETLSSSDQTPEAPEAPVSDENRDNATAASADQAASEPVARPSEKRALRQRSRRTRAARAADSPKPPPARSASEPGYLTVAAEPYATVYVDGRKLGDTPLVNIELSAGTYNLRGVAADGRVASSVVTVLAGSTVRHRLRYGE